MPKQSALSMRPGTILGYKGRAWKVVRNSTLDCKFQIRSLDPPYETKEFRYQPGDELDVRWVPFQGPKF